MSSMREELDRALSGMALSPARRAAILAAAERGEKPVKKVIRPALVLAAVLTALTVSALALVPGLRESLAAALGSFAPYSQTVEGVKAEDQGIEIEVLSALSDASTTKVYLAVRDKTGARIESGDVHVEGHIKRLGADDFAYSFGFYTVGYDEKTQSALFMATYKGSAPVLAEDAVSLVIDLIQPGYHRIETAPPPESLLTDRILETWALDDGETVLKPGQTEYVFAETDDIALSSMGFGSDGRFHILLELAEGVDPETSSFLTTLYSKSSADFETMVRYNQDIKTFGFSLGEKNYYEFSVLLGTEVYDDLRLYGIYGTAIDRALIEGEWSLKLNLEQVPQRNFHMNEIISGITYSKLNLSAFALNISGNPPSDGREGKIPYNMPVAVLLADGTVIYPKSAGGSYINEAVGDRSADRWEFKDAVDVDQVVGVAIGYWMIPLDGGTAGPGYWLKELP